ncbi:MULTISPECIES: glycosyltransferase family 4 protein [unclassified Pseudoalteromonas]|uniref:glycosyltransferase family 4 protein n=1 Tax=unclassified Pseudoalteromonas TaxID=194690 RepID=UPI0030143725
MKLHIIQPAIPKYRIPFFNNLEKKYDINFYTTETDFLGVKTVYESNKLVLSKGFKSFFNKIFWHKGLPLNSPYRKGDIVVINGNPRVLNYMLLFIFLRLKGVKTVWWGHGWTAGSYSRAAALRIYLMRLATAILVYTDKECMSLAQYQCYALNNGLDSHAIKNCIDKADAPQRGSSGFNLVFVGRITKKSNFEFLLHALSQVENSINLNVIGSCENIEYYKGIAFKLGLKDRVIWHGALFDECEIAQVMLSSHVFVYPGAVGLSLIHAFNYGLPAIIHSDSKYHMPEFSAFRNNINGYCFDKGNINDLVSKINLIFNLDEKNYMKMSNSAMLTISQSFNTSDMFNRFVGMIEDLKS